MFTLLGELHFWSTRDDIRIKPSDLGAFRYMRSREVQQQQDPISISKRDYTERRDGVVLLKNTKTNGQLKDKLKKFEELLATQKVVYAQWRDGKQLLLLFDNGVFAHICVEICTGDIMCMALEKYLVGKLAVDVINAAFFTQTHIVLAYNTNQLTVVHLQSPVKGEEWPEKITKLDPSIFHVIIPGPSERKLPRNLCVNAGGDMFVVWTNSSQNEVFPWRPTVRDQDRANIHVLKITDGQLESIAYCWSENDPLSVEFLRSAENRIVTIEQKVSRRAEISVEICSYEVTSGKMTRNLLTSIAVSGQICCFAFSPDQEKLFLGANDKSIYMHDLVSQSTRSQPQSDIIALKCSWHADSSLVMIANERSQFQCYDLALTLVGLQLNSDDYSPATLLDFAHYFAMQPDLLRIAFSLKPEMSNFNYNGDPENFLPDCFLLLILEGGPVACWRFFNAAGIVGDIHNSGLTADVLIDQYLGLSQLENAVNLMTALNWETYGAMCLLSLHKIANHVFYRGEVKRDRINLLRQALETFTDDLSEETLDQFSDQVFDLRRRFFFHLLMNDLFPEAFDAASDIGDYDLFMDLHYATISNENYKELSEAAYVEAVALHEEEEEEEDEEEEDDDEEESSVSSSNDEPSTEEYLWESSFTPCLPPATSLPTIPHHPDADPHYASTIPKLKPKAFGTDMIKINIPKPELRPDSRLLPSTPCPPSTLDVRYSKSVAANRITDDKARHSSDSFAIASNAQRRVQPQEDPMPGTSRDHLKNVYSFDKLVNTLPVPIAPNTGAIRKQPSDSPALMPKESLHLGHSPGPVPAAFPGASPQPKFYQHPLVSGTIPATPMVASYSRTGDPTRLPFRKPATSILSNASSAAHSSRTSRVRAANTKRTSSAAMYSSNKEFPSAKGSNVEKNKVKFSDTVQVAVVPEISRKEKSMPPKRNALPRHILHNLTNPKKELAESLPLCHPNDDYLKDFNPAPADGPKSSPNTKPSSKEDKDKTDSRTGPSQSSSIKVVHFGVV